MPPVGFEPTISAGERPQTYASDRAATGTGNVPSWCLIKHEGTFTFVHNYRLVADLRLVSSLRMTDVVLQLAYVPLCPGHR